MLKRKDGQKIDHSEQSSHWIKSNFSATFFNGAACAHIVILIFICSQQNDYISHFNVSLFKVVCPIKKI
jgi:hypothetical protein